MTGLGSRTVDWWAVHTFVLPILEEVKSWPMAGTLAWQLLDDTEPAKWASLLDCSRHWVLRVDTAQEDVADASKAVAASADWPAIGREMLQRRTSGVYIPRREDDDTSRWESDVA